MAVAEEGYPGGMIARAYVALGGATLTREDIAAGKLAECEEAWLSGEAPDTNDTTADWQAAQKAAGVPDDALVRYWIRG